MPKKKRRVEVATGEHRTHIHLWTGVLTLRHLSTLEKVGSDHPRLAASLFAFFALEAFLNYIGEQVAPEEWKHEREEFSGPDAEYRGTPGKLDFLLDRLGIAANYPKNDRPRSTISDINSLRDAVAHPRPEPILRATLTRDGSVEVPKAELYRLPDPQMLARVLKDVEDLADAILTAAQPHLEHGQSALGQVRAFHGSPSSGASWTGAPG